MKSRTLMIIVKSYQVYETISAAVDGVRPIRETLAELSHACRSSLVDLRVSTGAAMAAC